MKAHGLKVRIHAVEYLIARSGFVCTVLLEPSWNKAHILRVKWNCEEADRVSNLIAEMLVEADPEMKIETK